MLIHPSCFWVGLLNVKVQFSIREGKARNGRRESFEGERMEVRRWVPLISAVKVLQSARSERSGPLVSRICSCDGAGKQICHPPTLRSDGGTCCTRRCFCAYRQCDQNHLLCESFCKVTCSCSRADINMLMMEPDYRLQLQELMVIVICSRDRLCVFLQNLPSTNKVRTFLEADWLTGVHWMMYESGFHTHPCGAAALMGKSVHFDIERYICEG